MPPRLASSQTFSKINELPAEGVTIAIYFESALPVRSETLSKSVNGSVDPRDLFTPTRKQTSSHAI